MRISLLIVHSVLWIKVSLISYKEMVQRWRLELFDIVSVEMRGQLIEK